MAEIASKTAINEKQVIARSNNIEALKHLLNTRNKFAFTGYTLRRLPEQAPHLHVAGVAISVRPELEILNVGRNGQVVRYGYLKLYINKGHPLAEETGKYAGTMVHQFAHYQHQEKDIVDRKCCLVLDLFREELHMAPQNYQNRRAQITAACFEIASQWPAL
jgi:hypothetical protein